MLPGSMSQTILPNAQCPAECPLFLLFSRKPVYNLRAHAWMAHLTVVAFPPEISRCLRFVDSRNRLADSWSASLIARRRSSRQGRPVIGLYEELERPLPTSSFLSWVKELNPSGSPPSPSKHPRMFQSSSSLHRSFSDAV